MTATNWRQNALCRHFPLLPWIDDPDLRSPSSELAMGAVCLACHAFADCSVYVERHGITSGFWAGADRTPQSERHERGGAA